MGGAGFSSSKAKSESRTVDVTPSPYAGLRDPFSKSLTEIGQYNAPSYFRNEDLSQYYAPWTEGEEAALGGVRGSAAPTQNERYGDRLLGDTLQGRYLDPASNPWLSDTAASAAREATFQFEDATSANQINFSRAGQRLPESSAFAESQRRGNRDYAKILGDVYTNIYGENYQAERGRQMEADTSARNAAASYYERQRGLLEAEGLPRLVADLGYERGLSEFQARRDALLSASEIATNASLNYGTDAKSKSKSVGYSV